MYSTQYKTIDKHTEPRIGMGGLRPVVTNQSASNSLFIDGYCLSITNEQFNTYASDLGMT